MSSRRTARSSTPIPTSTRPTTSPTRWRSYGAGSRSTRGPEAPSESHAYATPDLPGSTRHHVVLVEPVIRVAYERTARGECAPRQESGGGVILVQRIGHAREDFELFAEPVSAIEIDL